MKFNLKGKTAIVTGGGSGIGKAISKTLAAHGAYVHILERKTEAADTTAREIESENGRASVHTCDIAEHTAVQKIIDTIADRGAVDILINNAGIAHIGNVEHTLPVDMDRIYEVNVKGSYNCIHAVIPHMKSKGGVILNMASIAATVGINDRFAYSMSKGAALSMMYSVAKDYLDFNIRCNSISPARIHTPFVDGYLDKISPTNARRNFRNFQKPSPSAGWENHRK